MKYIGTVCTVLIALLVLPAISSAQDSPVTKGHWMIDGSISFQSKAGDAYENAEGDGRTEITFSPAAGYFFMDQLAVGASILYTSIQQGDNTDQTNLEIGPYLAYYFKTGNPEFLPLLGAAVRYASQAPNEDVTLNKFVIQIFGGAVYMVTEQVGIGGRLAYSIVNQSYDIDGASEDPDSDSGSIFSFFVTVEVFIP